MAYDDYHVIVYRILAYLYACLKAGDKPNLEYLTYKTDAFPIGKDYWDYIMLELIQSNYIKGAVIVPILGNNIKSVKITNELSITPLGIEYLQDNSMMKKAFTFLKSIKEIVPGL